MPLPLLAAPTAWLLDHAVMVVGVAVVAVGLFVVGRRDVPRFSWGRTWAISGVCFAESVRRRVLWIIPLAIVGLVAIVQLQQPSDEQDAIRQTTKFCLFASGLVVVLSTLILACTNLPREIENRVIFTVVTKPTTRLEIVLGKVVGFARVSFVILLTMGVFTWGYLHLRARLLTADLRHRLDANQVEQISRPTLEHYARAGLLNAKTLVDPGGMDVLGRPPVAGSRRRFLDPDGYLLAPVALPPNLVAYKDPGGEVYKGPGLVLRLRLGYAPTVPPAPSGGLRVAPAAPAPAGPPQVTVQVFDPNANALLSTAETSKSPVVLPNDGSGRQTVEVDVPANSVQRLAHYPFVYVAVSPGTPGSAPWVEDDPADRAVQVVAPVVDPNGAVTAVPLAPADVHDLARPGPLMFTGRIGTFGQQIKGDPAGTGQVCVYRFRGLRLAAGAGVPVEMRVGIEKNSDAVTADTPTDVALTVTPAGGVGGSPAEVTGLHPENNRTLYAALPAEAVRSGDFDVALRCLSPEQWVALRPDSFSVVRADSSFALNLVKSLGVLWLLSILVTAISVFSSTFLTWPTAVVFTLVLLLGRWGLDELGDAAAAGLGRQFVADFGVTNVAEANTLADSIEKLNSSFKRVAAVLPDISAFSATDDVDRGIAMPVRTLWDAALVLVGFGLPSTVAAYVILKNKEVAP